jgi:ketosteroid isomerase-like protein
MLSCLLVIMKDIVEAIVSAETCFGRSLSNIGKRTMDFVRAILMVALLTLVVACDSGSSLNTVDAATEEKVITELEAKWSNLLGNRDLDGFTAMLAQDTVLIMPGSAPIVGVEDVRQATRAMLESEDEVSWKSDFAFVAPSGDMAYDYGTATTKLADGSTMEGSYLVLWVKEGGEWKIAADMFN